MFQSVKIHKDRFSKLTVIRIALQKAGIPFTELNIIHREYKGLRSFIKTNMGDFVLRVRRTEGPMIFYEVSS